MKPKILLMPDVPGWAFDFCAREHMVAGYDWREAVKNYDKWFTFALNNKGD